jgi:hypothetical protein
MYVAVITFVLDNKMKEGEVDSRMLVHIINMVAFGV